MESVRTSPARWDFAVEPVTQREAEPAVLDIHEAVRGTVGPPENVAIVDMPVDIQRRYPHRHSLEQRNVLLLDFPSAIFVLIAPDVRPAHIAGQTGSHSRSWGYP